MKFIRANAETAGAVEYKIAINIKAYPADFLASLTFGTVKNLTITCGKPAVPNIKAAVKKNGKILALDYDQIDDVGAYLRAPEPASLYRMHGNLSGPYLIEDISCRNRVVLTNKTPTGLNRGFGGPQHYYALERLVHKIANTLNLDHLKVIKLNLVKDKDFPYQSASGALLDSGQYSKLINKV